MFVPRILHAPGENPLLNMENYNDYFLTKEKVLIFHSEKNWASNFPEKNALGITTCNHKTLTATTKSSWQSLDTPMIASENSLIIHEYYRPSLPRNSLVAYDPLTEATTTIPLNSRLKTKFYSALTG
jgi:hypothetical protein